MQEFSKISVKTHSLSTDVLYKAKKVVSENIKYPEFSTACEYVRDEKVQNLVNKMNKFYGSAAKRLDDYTKGAYSKKAYVHMQKTGAKKPHGVCMNYQISYCGDNYVSVVSDISGFDGHVTRSERMAHTWSFEKCGIVSKNELLCINSASKKYIKECICQMVQKNLTNPFFGYFSDAQKLCSKHLSLNDFYLVPKGVAFFVNPGILCDVKYGASVFVVPYESAKEILRVKMQ